MKIKLNRIGSRLLICAVLFASTSAIAQAAYDGSSNLICAVIEVTACADANRCTRGQARVFDLPEFMAIDFKAKVISVTYDGGSTEAESPIITRQTNGNQLILQGIENGHGWTMAIHQDTGRMNVGVVGDELSYNIFGACTNR
jgi:hypothetical protein